MIKFSNQCSKGHIAFTDDNTDLFIIGTFTDIADNNEIYFIAANPPDYRQSFYGSGLPYHNKQQAFQNTPNKFTVILDKNKKFNVKMLMPNSFYDKLGEIFNVPHVIMSYRKNNKDIEQIIKLDNGIPYRTLTYPDARTILRKSPSFYENNHLPIRSQEQILIDSGFNSDKNDKSFWGLKPPM